MRHLFVWNITLVLSASLYAQSTTTTPRLPPATDKPSRSTEGPEATHEATPPPLKPVPNLSDSEIETFLKMAEITARKSGNGGTTGATRVTLSDGKLSHDAQIQCIDIFKPVWKGAEGTVEKNFRDTWKFNVAAYRVSRLLDIKNIPVSVERNVDGKQCAMTWWVDNVWLVEAERRDNGIKPPATDDWVNQLNAVRVFDQLIYNTDRNQGNLLITPDWKIWMIDHTRAFRTNTELMKVEPLRRIDKQLFAKLKTLNTTNLNREVGPWLRPEEMSAILVRRDLILQFFQGEIRSKGEDAILTGLPIKTPSVSVP